MSCLNCGRADHLACARFVSGPVQPKQWKRHQRWSEALFWGRVVATFAIWVVTAAAVGGILALVFVASDPIR